jgi:diguanylate cyclase (GGDEF)-like protein
MSGQVLPDIEQAQTAERVLAAINSLQRSAYLLVNRSLFVEWVSDGVASLLGFQPHELIGKHAAQIVHPDDAAAIVSSVAPDFATRTDRRALSHRPTIDIRIIHAIDEWVNVTVNISHGLSTAGVDALVVHICPPDHLRDVANGVIAATSGQPLPVSLGHLVRAMGLGLGDDAKAVLLDEAGAVLSQTPGSEAELGQTFDPTAWITNPGSAWSTPIVGPRSGRRLGSLVTFSGSPFAAMYDIRTAIDVAAHAGLLIEGQLDRSALEQAAASDSLTGLANRTSLLARLRHDGIDQKFVIFADLDGFKRINDTYGHSGGDEVLKTVAAILQSSIREGDLVARLGGDEFAILVSGMDSSQQVLRRLRSTFAGAMIKLEDELVGITASFGIAPYNGDPEATLDAADRAMYAEKPDRRSAPRVKSLV